MPSFALRVPAQVPLPQLVDALSDDTTLLSRLMAVASALRAIDPELGPYLRAYRRRLGTDGQAQPFKLVFTDDHQSEHAQLVISNPKNVDFFDALKDVLGEAFTRQEKKGLAARITKNLQGKPSGLGRITDAALQEAFLADLITAPEEQGVGNGVTYALVEALPVSDVAFLEAPDLADIVLREAPQSGQSMDNPVTRMRQRMGEVLQALSKPFHEATLVQRDKVVKAIEGLDRMIKTTSEGLSFEETMHHGWVGFSLAQGLENRTQLGWTSFLIHEAKASPYAFYGDLSPLALAVAADNKPAVDALLQAGVAPTTEMNGWPAVFRGPQQEYLENLGGTSIPMVVYAAAVGSTASLASLLKHGADPNQITDLHETALHRMAAEADAQGVKLLLDAGASAILTDKQGQRAEKQVPGGAQFDPIHAMIVAHANKEMAALNASLKVDVLPLPGPEALPQAKELWSRTPTVEVTASAEAPPAPRRRRHP